MATRASQSLASYVSGVRAVIFDWAGTIVDFGSLAPVKVFLEVFRRAGVEVTIDEAREPMGLNKRAHIEAMLAMPSVAVRWTKAHGRSSNTSDVDKLYADFLPLQLECLAMHAEPIPGAVETFAWCRQRGIRIGSCTGYTRELMDVLLPLAARRGIVAEAMVCGSDVPAGRPAPWMMFENMRQLGVFPPCAIVKVDDTVSGIEEGLNAGCWTVGTVESGNLLGLSLDDWQALAASERTTRASAGHARMRQAGAHFSIGSVADLPPVIDEINRRLARGEAP